MEPPSEFKRIVHFSQKRHFLFGMVGVMWLQVITVVMSSFCSSVPASNDLEPAGTIGPLNWNTSIECSSGDKFYWSHLSLQCWETSAEEMVLQYFRSLADVIHCANVKLHFPEPWNTPRCYVQQSNDHRNLTHISDIISANMDIIFVNYSQRIAKTLIFQPWLHVQVCI